MLSRRLALLLALACGVSVANIYLPQAISPLIASGLHVSDGAAALVVTATQLGYAAGIFLLVPLGDRLSHRPLIVTLLVLTGAELLVAGLAPSAAVLLVAATAVGVTAVTPQVIIPMAAGMADEQRRGTVVGTLMAGLLAGILLARTFSGTLGAWLGWRAPYLVAAAAMLALAGTLRAVLPHTTPTSGDRYGTLVAASLRLLRSEPELRRSCLYQATQFGAFTAAWTSLALLVTGGTYDLGTEAVGLIALVGATSALLAPAAGRWVDRYGADRVSLACFTLALASAGVLALAGHGGAAGLAALIAGMLLLDIAVQCGQVANQSRALAVRPEARSRLNTAYMTCAFLGGTLGSWLGVLAYHARGWGGVCGLIALLAATALARHAISLRAPRGRTTAEPAAARAGAGSGRTRGRPPRS